METKKLKGFVAGFIAASVAFSGLTAFSASGSKTIPVSYDNIKVYINGTMTPMVADGTAVEPFTYAGRTYVPLKAVSTALGQRVQWDEATNSIHISGSSTGSDNGLLYYYVSALYAADLMNQFNSDLMYIATNIMNEATYNMKPNALDHLTSMMESVKADMDANAKFICGISEYFSDCFYESRTYATQLSATIETSKIYDMTSSIVYRNQTFDKAIEISKKLSDSIMDMRDTSYNIYDQAMSE